MPIALVCAICSSARFVARRQLALGRCETTTQQDITTNLSFCQFTNSLNNKQTAYTNKRNPELSNMVSRIALQLSQ
jgi:hypothetical protein